MSVDYDKLNKVVRRQKAALTRAIKTGDPSAIVAVCRAAVAEWNAPGMIWPDDWSCWQRALDDAYPVFHAPRLEDFAVEQRVAKARAVEDAASKYAFEVKFTVEAPDWQTAISALHTSLVRAMFPDDIDWQVTFTLPAPNAVTKSEGGAR